MDSSASKQGAPRFLNRNSTEYVKLSNTGSKRALTSHPGRRPKKYRIASASVSASGKASKLRKSEQDGLVDNPYTSGMNDTGQNFFKPDDDSTMINITTKDKLNRTENLSNNNNLVGDSDFIHINNSNEEPLSNIKEKPGTASQAKRRIQSGANPRKAKINYQKGRIQTAKYGGSRRPSDFNKVRGQNQYYNYSEHSKKCKSNSNSVKSYGQA